MKYLLKIFFFFFILYSLSSFFYLKAQENQDDLFFESIYKYLTAEEAFFLINYSSLEELKKIADALGLTYSPDATLEDLKKLLYEFYGFTEMKKGKSEEVIYIKTTDFLRYSDENKIIELIGNNLIVYKDYLFKADRFIFYIDDEIIYGYGNISFQNKSLNLIADSFEYSLTKKNGVFKNATIYSNNYIISTPLAYISNNDTLITEKATVTQCNYQKPHYYIIVDKVLFSESLIFFYNLQFVIGSEKLFYFPLYISYEEGYNYPLLFGMDYGYREGFMLFNTLKRKNYSIYFDIYEKLGLYLGFETKGENKNINYTFLGGFALSPDLFYYSTSSLWSIIPPDVKFTINNLNLRAGLNGMIKFNFQNGFYISLKYAFFTDPYFNYDYFLRERFLRFDITQFTEFDWTDDYDLFPSTNLTFNEEIQSGFKIMNFNVNISSSLSFTAEKNESLDQAYLQYYLYSPKYYQYYLSSIKWYSLNLSGNLFSISEDWINFNISNSYYSNYLTYYNSDKVVQKESLSASTSITPTLSIRFKFFSYSLSMSNNISYVNTTTDSITESLIYYSTLSNSFVFQVPIFRITLNLSQSYRNSFLEPIDFGWLSNSAGISINISPFSFLNFSANLNYNFLDSTNYNLWEFSAEKFESINLNGNFNYQFISANWNSKINLLTQDFLYHQFNLSLTIPKMKILFFWLNISNNLSIKLDNQNPFNSFFENNFYLVFSIEKEIQIIFNVSSYNQFLYRYSSLEEVMLDLLDSFNFFDYEARLNSNFDLRSLSISLTRYLHDITIQFKIGGSFVLSSDKTQYNFVLSYSVYIISTFLTGYQFSEVWESIF